MSCDITIFAEVKNKQSGRWEKVGDVFSLRDKEDSKKEKTDHPFYWQDYGLFGFLADVRNYSESASISKPKGIPNDVSDDIHDKWLEYGGEDHHSNSHLKLSELMSFNYEKKFINRRGQDEDFGKTMTYREFLGETFFIHLNELKQLGYPADVRIVFWFDNL